MRNVISRCRHCEVVVWWDVVVWHGRDMGLWFWVVFNHHDSAQRRPRKPQRTYSIVLSTLSGVIQTGSPLGYDCRVTRHNHRNHAKGEFHLKRLCSKVWNLVNGEIGFTCSVWSWWYFLAWVIAWAVPDDSKPPDRLNRATLSSRITRNSRVKIAKTRLMVSHSSYINMLLFCISHYLSVSFNVPFFPPRWVFLP